LKLEPDLKKLYEQRDQYNLQMVSIAYDDDPQKVREHVLMHDIYWINLFDDRKSSLITDQYKVSIFPTFILIDPGGKIVKRGVGKEALQQIEQWLRKDR
jgi:hypothetical protein